MTTCVLTNKSKIVVPRLLSGRINVGDEIVFPIPAGETAGAEILVTKHAASSPNRVLYHVPIGCVTQPRADKRNQLFVSAEVRIASLGIASVFLSCEILRGYFYRLPQRNHRPAHATFYDLLRIPMGASSAELRVAFKLRVLELKAAGAPRAELAALERAFNIVGQPELRACYDALLADPDAPAVFPYGGFGSLLVEGVRSRDGETFFAHRILAFSPERRRRRFHAPLRMCEFYDDSALYRDVRRKLEFWLDTRPDAYIFPNARKRKGAKTRGFIRVDNYLKRVLKPMAEKLGLPKLNFQVLRRTVATLAQELGNPKDVQGILRHAKLGTTTDVYMQEIEANVKRTQDAFFNKLVPKSKLAG